MSTRSKPKKPVTVSRRTVTLDRAHLSRYTMDNHGLEREIIALFLQQLPVTMTKLENAANHADWTLAVHTLKGSAAAVGATRLNALAVELEKHIFNVDIEIIENLLMALNRAIAQFERAARRIYK